MLLVVGTNPKSILMTLCGCGKFFLQFVKISKMPAINTEGVVWENNGLIQGCPASRGR